VEEEMKKLVFFVILSVCGLCSLGAQVLQGNKVTRKVVSYNLWGNEYVDQIDRVELEWSKTSNPWLPSDYNELSGYTTFTANQPSVHEHKMSSYNAANGAHWTAKFPASIGLRGDFYTLKMTIYQKDGDAGSLTFYGGEGVMGDDIRWTVTYLPSDSQILYYRGHSSWTSDGSLLWIWTDGEPEIPTLIKIENDETNGKNKIVFADIVRDSTEPLITIELDGSFFP
jgi:hypothetical protein